MTSSPIDRLQAEVGALAAVWAAAQPAFGAGADEDSVEGSGMVSGRSRR